MRKRRRGSTSNLSGNGPRDGGVVYRKSGVGRRAALRGVPWVVLTLAGAAVAQEGISYPQPCEFFAERLRSTDAGNLISAPATESAYCVVRLEGSGREQLSRVDPRDLFHPTVREEMSTSGWTVDSEADGPDGTSFVLDNGVWRCRVEGRWDAGDDSDPSYVPSTVFSVTVSCNAR